MAGTGCGGQQEFRAASSAALELGMSSIATGLIDGLFAMWEPGTGDGTTSSNGSSSSSTSG
jgi:hypothetical protein